MAGAGGVQLTAQRKHLSARIPDAARLDLATLRRSEDSFVDELDARRRAARLSADARALSALLRRRQPRALRARSAHVRGPAAVLRQYPLDAGGRRAWAPSRGWSATPRKSTASAFRSTTRSGASRACTSPITARLRRLFTRVHRDFGAAVLIDCHSMPSTAGAKDERPRADVVLGDRYGTSCVAVVAETIEATLRGLGYSVSRNKPYAGGFITEHYGNPAAGLHAIQLELNRALYMDERRYERSPSFARLGGRPRERWPTGWPRSRSRNCGPTAPRPNSRPFALVRKKKGPLADASGPSLGRKRPRRAAVTRGATAPQQIHRSAQKARAKVRDIDPFRCIGDARSMRGLRGRHPCAGPAIGSWEPR